MKKVIIIKYGELSTKKDNISFFLKRLKSNIERSLKDIDHKLDYDYGRMFIETNDFDKTLDKLKKTFGIHEISVGIKLPTNKLEDIKSSVISDLSDKQFNTFKVVTKRSDKSYKLNSMEVSASIGGSILKALPNSKVDVKTPELTVNVEIRSNSSVYYFEKIKGLGGYPVGTQGKSLLMLSGGIDSPVAGYLAIKRGISLDCIYFDSPPHTSKQAKDKVFALANILKDYDANIGVYVVNFTKMQETILKNLPNDYLITIMRRMMYRISERVANKNKCHTIVNGESIGQVASQTLTSMKCINETIKIPVIRPVACLDKLEIIDIANKIGTYETSILPYEDCCTIFLPKHPVINPTIKEATLYEKDIDFESIIDEIMENLEYFKVENTNKFEDIL